MAAASNYKMEIKGDVNKFLTTTTVKGVAKLSQSKDISLKILWILALLFGTLMAVYLLYGLSSYYFSHKVSTQVAKETDFGAFPDITVCWPYPFNDKWYSSVLPFREFIRNNSLQILGNFFNILSFIFCVCTRLHEWQSQSLILILGKLVNITL